MNEEAEFFDAIDEMMLDNLQRENRTVLSSHSSPVEQMEIWKRSIELS